jgi:hypothetical protein
MVGWLLNYARKLEHPTLFKWISVIFILDLIIPDMVPFVDELLLGLAAMFLGSWKKSRSAEKPASNQRDKDPVTRNKKRGKGPREW